MTPAPPPLSLRLLGAGGAAFFAMGVLQPLYGPMFPAFQGRFGVSTATVGLIASAHFVGSAVAPPLVGLLLARLSTRRLVVGGLLLLILGVVGVGLAPSWPLALAAAALAGVGFGGVSGTMNAVLASAGTRAINFANALFGLASMLAPLVAVALAPRGLIWPFLIVAALAGLSLLAAQVWGVPAVPPPRAQGGLRRVGRAMTLFVLMLICYVGLEVGFGAWGGKHLQGLGFGSAAVVISLYWGGFTLGRALTSAFGARLRPERLMLGSALLTTLCALAALRPSLAPLAYPLAGLTLGPVFGASLVWAARQLPVRLVPLLLVAGSVGGILGPAGIGLAFARFGPAAVPGSLALLGTLLCLLIALTTRILRPVARAAI